MFDVEITAQQIKAYQARGLKLFTTSSFQTHSIPLLHILSQIDKNIPIYFLNTGYHFPETLAFRDEITDLLGLNLINLQSPTPKYQQRDQYGRLMFTSDPEYCCYMNKIQPLEPIIQKMDVWINGVRADQNSNRKQFKVEEQTPDGTLRYHPMLFWTSKMIYDYRKLYNLPPHPLEAKGYLSIGCEPCTRSYLEENESRSGRWMGMSKNECGLHTDLIKK